MAKKTDAVEAYRQALIDDDVEKRIAELATQLGAWHSARETRKREADRLAKAEADAEDQVVAAWEAARLAGARPTALEQAGLKPVAAIAAVAKRSSKKRATSGPPAAAAAPLTPPPSAATSHGDDHANESSVA